MTLNERIAIIKMLLSTRSVINTIIGNLKYVYKIFGMVEVCVNVNLLNKRYQCFIHIFMPAKRPPPN